MEQISLSARKCKPCSSNQAPVSQEEIKHYLSQLSNWQLNNGKIEREIKVKDFRAALDLANRIGEIAEREDHHPDLTVSWGLLKISIFTHAIKGLSENDFILAAKINECL